MAEGFAIKMSTEDYLDVGKLKKECSKIKSILIKNDEDIDTLDEVLADFVGSDLKSVAWNSIKDHISLYAAVTAACMEADSLDLVDVQKLVSSADSCLKHNVYNGNVIYSEGKHEYDKMVEYLNSVDYYMGLQQNNPYCDYSLVIGWYSLMALSHKRAYKKYKELNDEFFDFESDTSGLFVNGNEYRQLAYSGLLNLQKKYDGKGYVIDEAPAWLVKLNDLFNKKLSSEIATKQGSRAMLKAYGYTDKEISYLEQQKVYLSASDMINLRRTKGNNKTFVSSDKKAIFYGGKVYVIFVPDYLHQSYDMVWKNVGSKRGFDCNLTGDLSILKHVSEISLPDKNEVLTTYDKNGTVVKLQDKYYSYRYTNKAGQTNTYRNKNVGKAGALGLLPMVNSFISKNLDSTTVDLEFQKSGTNGECRRVIINVSNFQKNQYFSNLPYNSKGIATTDSYSSSDGCGKTFASEYAKGMYEQLKGKKADKDKNYTIVTSFSERHRENSVCGHLYYDKYGTLMYQPVVYPDDKANISTLNKLDQYGFNPTMVYDATDLLPTPSECDPYVSTVLDMALNR